MNISLVGMSGAGKSFLGKKLADDIGYNFIDIDVLLEKRFGKPVQEILDEVGEKDFLREEEWEVLQLQNLEKSVIAPGGSIVYSNLACNHLKKISRVIYLSTSVRLIIERTKPDERGIVGLKGRTFEEVYGERIPLYEGMANYCIEIGSKNTKSIIEELKGFLEIN